MIKIEVTAEVLEATGPKRPRNQVVYAYHLSKDGKPQPHPVRTLVPLWSEDQPYAPGNYTLAPQSVYTDRFGNFALAPKLVALASGRGGA